MNTKHTPGPWELGEIEQGQDGGEFVAIDGKNPKKRHMELARVVWKMEDDERSLTQEANARLIAAAPDLLDALQAAISRQGYRPGEGPDWWEQGRAAIAKATGGAA